MKRLLKMMMNINKVRHLVKIIIKTLTIVILEGILTKILLIKIMGTIQIKFCLKIQHSQLKIQNVMRIIRRKIMIPIFKVIVIVIYSMMNL